MQILTTAGQMQQLDISAIRKYSIPSIVLMENAGRAFVDILEKHVGPSCRKHFIVICGKGNNGGDGFVIARHLSNRGANVNVVLLAGSREIKGDAKQNLAILEKMIGSTKGGVRLTRSLSKTISPDQVIVDAILGTGFTGTVRKPYKKIINRINESGAYVASVDIPSGVNATTGAIEKVAVIADLTITMGAAKVGHFVGAGRDHSGIVEVADISIPDFLLESSKNSVCRVEMADVRELLPKRKISAHKNSVGRIFVLSGSRYFTGAPVMTCQSAMRTGAGAVILGIPHSIHPILVEKLTEVMITPLAETHDGSVASSAWEVIQEKIEWADVVAIGPGLSMDPETQEVVHRILQTCRKPVVLDADGINAASSKTSIVKKRKYPTVLTPHVGELRKLINKESDFIETNRVDVVREVSKVLNCTICLKGSPTVTTTRGKIVYLNSTGNPGMATAGSGDVLTGIIASLIGQGMNEEAAAYCGVFIHGKAGDLAANKFGERSLMALDILDAIPDALKAIEAR